MVSTLFTITIDINDFIEYIKSYCDEEELYYNDIDIEMALQTYIEEKNIIYKPISKLNDESFYTYVLNTLNHIQINKDILDEIEEYKQKIIELQNKLEVMKYK